MIGGGPFHLKPGEWTDDTSMVLCLAQSLIEKRMLAQIVANHLGAIVLSLKARLKTC